MTGRPIAESVRAGIERAMRTTHDPVQVIADETGVSAVTIRSWNRRHGWRPTAATAASGFDPGRWNAGRRAALARLYPQPWLDIGDLALAMGVPMRRAEALFAACGLEGRRPGEVAGATGPETDPRRLRAALRAHIARQIVRFDAALNAQDDGGDAKTSDPKSPNLKPSNLKPSNVKISDPKTFDSARVLRDLGGLKRLLDEADRDERARGAEHGAQAGGDGGTADHDLPALRAQIARRLDALRPNGPDSGCPGEPASAPDPGPGD